VLLIAVLIFALLLGFSMYRLRSGINVVIPTTIDRDIVNLAFGRLSVDEFLSKRREGYAIYRYIGEHDLRAVFSPFHHGTIYAPAYNESKKNGRWILSSYTLPKQSETVDEFVAENGIRYFIYEPFLREVVAAGFGQDHIERANRVYSALLPRSRLLFTDSLGWSLYEIMSPL
jgi:hypothetical protein